MIRVRIYKPEIRREKKKGEKNFKAIIVNKKKEFVSERSVMNKTFDQFDQLESEDQEAWIINNKMYMEEVDLSEKGLSERKKEDLTDLAEQAGIKDLNNLDKKTIVERIAAFYSPNPKEGAQE